MTGSDLPFLRTDKKIYRRDTHGLIIFFFYVFVDKFERLYDVLIFLLFDTDCFVVAYYFSLMLLVLVSF